MLAMPLAVFVLALCLGLFRARPARAQTSASQTLAAHFVNRLSYGPVPGELERVRGMGVQAYVDEQLSPENIPEPQSLTDRLALQKTGAMDTVQLFRTYGPKAPGGPRSRPTLEEINEAKEKAAIIAREAAEARLWRAILSPRQLQEVLVDFWYNHFNVPSSKGLAHLWVGSYEREAIRPFVLGKFEDMLVAVTRHPAMLINLENWQSSTPESQEGKGMQRPLLEMHARELMTSHTMGPDARAKPQDVTNLARMLAGWTIGAPRTPQDKNGFLFDERRHDKSDKTFLGQTIKSGGMSEGLEALHLLAKRPETAHHVSLKLVRFFLADEPPKELVESLSKTFLETDGNIRKLLVELFASPEFSNAKYVGSKFKTPLRAVVSLVRASGRPLYETGSLAEHLSWMGMPLYDALGPSGYKDVQGPWLAADGMLKRLDFAAEAGGGGLPCWSPGSYRALEPLDVKFMTTVMGLSVSEATSKAVEAAPAELKSGVLLGSPEGLQY